MRVHFTLSFWILIVLMVGMAACGDQTINFPSPTMTSISPTTAVQNSPQITVTVTGNDFVQGTTVGVATTPQASPAGLVTLFVDTSTLTATLPASLLTTAQTLDFSVTTPQPGGGTFPPANQTKIVFPFIVTPAQSPVPHVTSMTPATVLASTSNAITIFVNGSGFVPQSIATLNQKNLTTTFSSPSSLQAQILGTDLTAPGTAEIGVLNPQPGGGVSNAISLSVVDPVPTITSLTPTSILAGGVPPSITLTGTGYVNQFTSINVNASPFPLATIASPTSAFIPFTAANLAIAGVDQIVAVNSQPGGGTSAIVTFAVNPTHLLGLPILVDLAADGSQANNGICGGVSNCQNGALGLTSTTAAPSTSDTGQFVAFPSASHNLVLTDTNPSTDVYLRNTCLGIASCLPLTSVISIGPGGIAANGSSSQVTINNAGTTAAFTSTATNLVTAAPVPGGKTQVYWTQICVASTTTSCTSVTAATSVPQLISISADGLSAGNGPSFDPVISADGEFVAFVSLATNLVTDITPGGVIPQVYIRDTCNISTATNTGTCVPTTFLVSTPDSSTSGNGASSNPSISDSGLFVSFTSLASNLGATAPNPSGASEIFERSTCVTTITSTTNTCVPLTTLVSTPDGATPADGTSDESSISNCGSSVTDNCTTTTTASNGRFVAFASTGTNLVAGAGPTQQIYVRDTCTGIDTVTTTCAPSTTLVSTASTTTTLIPGNGLSEHPSINASGQFVAFSSLASNLANTTNGVENVFVRNTCLAVTVTCTTGLAISSIGNGANAAPSNGQSLVPSISSDGHTVSFLSFSNNQVPRDTNGVEDIFLGTTTF